MLAYRLQSDAFGDLDKSIRRNLRSEKDGGVGVPFDRRAPQTRQGVALKAGALLVREWKGRLERVMILEEGFAWNGQTFGSLAAPTQPVPSRWGPFSHVVFTVIWTASVISNVGTAMFDTASGWLITSLDANPIIPVALREKPRRGRRRQPIFHLASGRAFASAFRLHCRKPR